MSPEREYEDDEEQEEHEEFGPRSIFAAGWFRAVLVLTVLAIAVVVSLPYLLNWFEPVVPPARTAMPTEPSRPVSDTMPPPPAPTRPSEAAPAPAVQPAPKPSAAPVAPAPVLKAVEKPAATPPVRKAAPEKPVVERAAPAKSAGAGKIAKAGEAPSRPVSLVAAKGDGTAGGGSYWVQLGAFKEQKNADSLARALRSEGFPVEVTRITRGTGEEKWTAPQRHELFVTDASVAKVNAALKGRGSAQAVPGGVTVKPVFPLQEAMVISKQLAEQGLKVIIRPAAGSVVGGSGATFHVVRAGGYPDRPRALAARNALQSKGHPGGVLTLGLAQ